MSASGKARHGWTAERRARQAEAIRRWQPWEQSTGPRTEAGRARSARNADKGVARQEQLLRELRRALAEQSVGLGQLCG